MSPTRVVFSPTADFSAAAADANVTQLWAVTRPSSGDGGTTYLDLSTTENTTFDQFNDELVGFAYRRDYTAANATSLTAFSKNVSVTDARTFSEYVEDTYSENFTEEFEETVSHTFSANFTDMYASYMNYSYAQNFSTHVVESFNATLTPEVYTRVVTASEGYSVADGTPAVTGILTHWADFRHATSVDTGNLTRWSTTAAVNVTYYTNGSGYITLLDKSGVAKGILRSDDGTDRYLHFTNRSERVYVEVKWRLRDSSAAGAGSLIYIQDYAKQSGGAVLSGTNGPQHTANFDWVTEGFWHTPHASANYGDIILIVGDAWGSNSAKGALDVEYVKVYTERYYYAVTDDLDLNFTASVPELSNGSLRVAGVYKEITMDVSRPRAGVNRLDYDFDTATTAGSTQNAPVYVTNETSFLTKSQFGIYLDDVSYCNLTDPAVHNWSRTGTPAVIKSGECCGELDGVDEFRFHVDFDTVDVYTTVNLTATFYFVFVTDSFDVSWTVDEWVNETVEIEFDLLGTGNYTYYDLEENETAREEINFVLASLTETYMEELFEETVSHVFSVTAEHYFGTWVNHTEYFYSEVGSLVELDVELSVYENLTCYVTAVSVSVVNTVSNVTTTVVTNTTVTVVSYIYKEYRYVPLDVPVKILYPSYTSVVYVTLVSATFDPWSPFFEYTVLKIGKQR